MKICKTYFESPVGLIEIQSSPKGICQLSFIGKSFPRGNPPPIILDCEKQLMEYFEGKRKTFDLELDLQGTDFQQQVWKALLDIPFGETRSYGELAKIIGNPKAVRAVGLANGKNPLPIIIPCHRIIGADGSLTGYGGGIERKKWLLDHEQSIIQPTLF